MRVSLAVALLLICSSASAASFDCSRSTTLVEQSICANKQLSDLDDSLAAAYKKATAAGNPNAVRNRQREWLLGERNKCQDVACVKNAYVKRLAELTGPKTPISVDCSESRLTAAETAMCEVPEFRQLGQEIDNLTTELEQRLSGTNKEALLDTEGPFAVERNNCQNMRPEVKKCVERVLVQRQTALHSAVTMPDSIRGEVALYQFLNPAFVLKYGESLAGRRVHVFGCLTLDPGPVTEERLKGRILESCSKPKGPQIPVVFKAMDQTTVNFYDDKTPSSHWEGIAQHENGRIVLRME